MQVKQILAVTFFLGTIHAAQAAPQADEAALCNQAMLDGDHAKALTHAEAALARDAKDREALLCQGRALSEAGQYEPALAAMEAALQLSITPLDRIVTLTLTGNVQRDAKHYDAALASYRQSLTIAQAKQEKRFERINHNLIGETLIATNQLDAGLKSYHAGAELAANDTERADNFSRIAQTYSSLRQYDEAVNYQIKTMLTLERSGDFNQYAYACLKLGQLHAAAGNHAEAEKAFNRIIERSKTQGAKYWEARGYYTLALEKIATGQQPEADALLAQAQRISQQIGADELNQEITVAMGKTAR